MRTETSTRTSETFDRMEQDERWLGFGYLNERRHALSSTDPESPAQPEMVAEADARVLAYAKAQGWSDERLFEWANSKRGRYYGDAMFGGAGDALTRWGVALAWGVLR